MEIFKKAGYKFKIIGWEYRRTWLRGSEHVFVVRLIDKESKRYRDFEGKTELEAHLLAERAVLRELIDHRF